MVLKVAIVCILGFESTKPSFVVILNVVEFADLRICVVV